MIMSVIDSLPMDVLVLIKIKCKVFMHVVIVVSMLLYRTYVDLVCQTYMSQIQMFKNNMLQS